MKINKIAMTTMAGFISLASFNMATAAAPSSTCDLKAFKADKTVVEYFTVSKDSDGGLKLEGKNTSAGMPIFVDYAKTNKCELYVISAADMAKGMKLGAAKSDTTNVNEFLVITAQKASQIRMANIDLGAKKILADGSVVKNSK